nr:hypothetical protein [Tanacetum cinerariifolium]
MDPNSSVGKICLGDDVVVISSDKVEGSGDLNSLEYQDMAGSKGKKFVNALSLYRMETDEISERKKALAIRISQKFALLEEERLAIETMAYNDKYKNILDEIWRDKVELDGKIVKEEEKAVKRIKGEALKEKDDHGAFIFLSRLERKVNKNALVDTGVYHQTFRAVRFDVLRTAESDSDDKEEYVIKRNKFGAPIYGPKPAPYLNCTNPEDRSSAIQTTAGTHDGEARSSRYKCPRQHEQWKRYCFHRFIMSSCYGKNVAEMLSLEWREMGYTCLAGIPGSGEQWLLFKTGEIRVLGLGKSSPWVTQGLTRCSGLLRDLDSTTLRDLIDYEGKLIPEDPQQGVPRVGILRPSRASMQYLYDRMGRMEMRQDAIKRMEYRQSYHWDRYHGVFEHMAGVYSVSLHGAYNPPGYAQP